MPSPSSGIRTSVTRHLLGPSHGTGGSPSAAERDQRRIQAPAAASHDQVDRNPFPIEDLEKSQSRGTLHAPRPDHDHDAVSTPLSPGERVRQLVRSEFFMGLIISPPICLSHGGDKTRRVEFAHDG
mgnify:CR=1 FL=1